MLRFFAALCGLLLASPLSAACTGPSAFDTLAAEAQSALTARASAVPHSTGILWQVEKNGVTSTIVGTFHVHLPGHAATLDRLQTLMPRPEQVFLEITTPDQKAFEKHLLSNPDLFTITSGPSLMERLGTDLWTTLLPRFQDIGLPPFMATKYQPWFLGLTLAIPPCALSDMRAGLTGLDRQIETAALAADLPVASLDTTDSLLALLASDPLEDQVEEMRWALSLDLDPTGTDDIATIIALYQAEQIQLIWEYNKHATQSRIPHDADSARMADLLTKLERDLLIARNTAWVETLAPALSETPSLVAIGAMHLPGDQGVLTLLEQQGFTVTRLPLRPD